MTLFSIFLVFCLLHMLNLTFCLHKRFSFCLTATTNSRWLKSVNISVSSLVVEDSRGTGESESVRHRHLRLKMIAGERVQANTAIHLTPSAIIILQNYFYCLHFHNHFSHHISLINRCFVMFHKSLKQNSLWFHLVVYESTKKTLVITCIFLSKSPHTHNNTCKVSGFVSCDF